MKQELTIKLLCKEARVFAEAESSHTEPAIYGVHRSSCPFKNARQKIFGLGYSLLLFIYEKIDDQQTRTARLNILHSIFIEAEKTADYQITTGILNIIKNNGNRDDIVAFMQDRLLPVEEIQALQIVDEIIANPPNIGYLTISNAL